jgi:hypothetical protein
MIINEMINELEEYADEWDLYKYTGTYNVSILIGDDTSKWLVSRGYPDIPTAIRDSIEKHKIWWVDNKPKKKVKK